MQTDILSKIKAADEAKRKALSGLHRELGYASAQALADAIVEAAGTSERSDVSAGKSVKRSATTTAKRAAKGRGRRISDETKLAIETALKNGEPGSRLTSKFQVSYGVIHQLKQKLGLVKPNSRAAKPKKAGKKGS